MSHEPWAVVCPTTHKPLREARESARPAVRIPKPAGAVRPGQPIRGGGASVPVVAPAVKVPAPKAASSANRHAIPPSPGVPKPSASQGRLPAVTGLVGRVVGDRYGVRGVIGEGGMGVVYEAEHFAIGRMVALKVLHPSRAQDKESISRLRHEARVAGTLGHPNICAVYDMGRLDDGSPYLVMERLHGETLAQRLTREGKLPPDELFDVLVQVLSALVVAHQRGVIHRDLKPDNIFLAGREGARPVPKLLDFGISKAEDVEETMADPTGGRQALGTPFYMAPEQARGDRKLDSRVDLWAAGVVLYEGLTGHHPFEAKNYNALLVQILSAKHRAIRELVPDLSPALEAVVDRALQKRPEDRFQSAMEFQGALRSLKSKPEAQTKPLPLLINEQTSEDPDATAVFSRIDVAALRGVPALPDEADTPTPVYPSPFDVPSDLDDEHTVVEPPAFLNDTITTVRRDLPIPPRKKG